MEDKTTILIFLGVALVILALAFLFSRPFKKSSEQEVRNYDLNGDNNSGDASGHATWIAIDKSSKDDLDFH